MLPLRAARHSSCSSQASDVCPEVGFGQGSGDPGELQEGGLTWWQVSTRAVHTKMPEMLRASVVVRKSREVP